MNRKRIIIICPGRGSYTRETQGYLKKYIQSSSNKIKYMDNERNNAGLPTLTEIDSQTFTARVHMKGEHASTLIYACSLIDYYSIDQSKYKIVAIIGNSMGWYSALAFSESLHYQKAYGFIDIKTSRYIAPPSGSRYDANLNIYNPRSDIGRVNLSTGSYIPPKGTRLNSAGQFEALDEKISNDQLKKLNTRVKTRVTETTTSIRNVNSEGKTAIIDELIAETSRGEDEESIAENVVDQLSEITNEIESSNSTTSLNFNIVIITDEE